MFNTGKRRGRRMYIPRVWAVMVIALIAVSLAPVAPASAGAQLDESQAAEEAASDEGTSTETPPAETPPAEIPTDDATATEESEVESLPGQVAILYHVCPAGTELATSDGATMASACLDGQDGVQFDLVSDGGYVDTSVTGDAGFSTAYFADVPPGAVQVTRSGPQVMEVAISCSSSAATYSQSFGPSAQEGISVQLLEGDSMTCDWFVSLDGAVEVTGGYGEVYVHKHVCPPGYDSASGDVTSDCQEAEAAGEIEFTVTAGAFSETRKTSGGTPNDAVFLDVPSGDVTITEIMPPAYDHVVVHCRVETETGDILVPSTPLPVAGGPQVKTELLPDTDLFCDWYNVPAPLPSVVTINKWECPESQAIDPTWEAHQTACVNAMDGVTFTLADAAGPRSQDTTGGQVQWTDVASGPLTVAETVPEGYSAQPFVVCGSTATVGGNVEIALPVPVDSVNGVLSTAIMYPGTELTCDWYNQYLGPGEITVYKWTCPDGYDPYAWSADPKADCTLPTNGVTFVLDQPVDADLQSDTGDSIDGAVYFGGLQPGDYTLTEQVPDGIGLVFVLECSGLQTGAVHPVPLSVGPTFELSIAGGDQIVCNWYNVPEPEHGWLTVVKYICWTPSYESDVDCEVFEDGIGFSLQVWGGSTWSEVASGTTDGAGEVTFHGLENGTYRVVEHGGDPCHIETTASNPDGHPTVEVGSGTTVKVYNCSTTPPPPPSNRIPPKFPNTGVAPEGQETVLPGMVSMVGLAGATAVTRRRFLRNVAASIVSVGATSFALGSGLARQQERQSATSTAESECVFPATPVSASGTCRRGEVPASVRIDRIGVDANIEILEIIGNEMQAPTGPDDVAWYKESARLGERGNILLAGHLNYWGVPEGVFFRLGSLQAGDAIEVEGVDGEVYRYRVDWTELFPVKSDPPERALGHTDHEALTLITCGGAWDVDEAEYDHRTVVRAVREETESAE